MRSIMLLSTTAAMIVSAGVVVAGAGSDTKLPAIERAELEFQQSKNVYEAIHALRHDWLVQGQDSRGVPAVFIAMRCTEVTCLRWLEAEHVEEVRYLNPYRPISGWPPANDNGSIVVTLRMRSTVLTPDVDRK